MCNTLAKVHHQAQLQFALAVPLNNTHFPIRQQLNGPSGAYIRSILFDGQTIYAASGGGVLASDDQGSTWSLCNEGLKSCDTKSFTQLGDYVFVSTDENVSA